MDLGKRMWVTGITTQGSNGQQYRVTQYEVCYHADATSPNCAFVEDSPGAHKVMVSTCSCSPCDPERIDVGWGGVRGHRAS